jgi:hypothetical protein
MGRDLWWRTWRASMPVLEQAELEDPDEQRALRDLHRSYRRPYRYRRRRPTPEDSMRALARFWEE